MLADAGTRIHPDVLDDAGIEIHVKYGHLERRQIARAQHDPETCPVYIRKEAEIPVYPERIRHTGELDDSRVSRIVMDSRYSGIHDSALAGLVEALKS